MRIVMLGTGPFAVPTFRALLASRHEVPALITRPPRPVHGKQKSSPTPMRDVALECGLPVHAPESINDAAGMAILKDLAADLFVVCDYGQILSADALGLARLGGINLHASLLPKYRGAAPINWAIYHGEQETGVTVIHMTPKLDGGPALVVRRTPIGSEETTPELERRLSEIGVEAVLEAIALLEADAGATRGVPQDQTRATRAPRLKKEDGLVDWSRSAEQIRNQVRAFQPWPGTYTYLLRECAEPLRLILAEASVVSADEVAKSFDPSLAASIAPGGILWANGKEVAIATGNGSALSLLQVQPAGKRVMRIDEFQNGLKLKAGERFGAA